MLQFYFFSVLFNAITGLVLVFSDKLSSGSPVQEGLLVIVQNRTFRFVLGLLTMITGFLKLVTVVRGDVPVIGDIFPACAGLVGGFILVYEYYKSRPETTDEKPLPNFAQKIISWKQYVGYVMLAAAVLHLLFPQVLFI
ncbi:hypothetical protein K7I13_01795 [Brucepastera parasyntrophica]|uniref:hypothetical protein n=1 Tax=Brucepastera parasyntrophica TaxID=2880008 RepID=UPI00210CAD65|nr:hypothetical protein [Brucepastera parasyntrophica]ULQ60086.1 hypothetical protein K7I13_01795 [Brucepastera parasyntrophica]